MFFYKAYGLILKSNLAIPGLQKTAIFKQPDITINLKYPIENVLKQPNWQNKFYEIDFQDGTKYLVNKQATEIFGNWQHDETLESATTYLTGPILGFILSLRGVTCLHASAVNIKGNAIAFTGDSNAGKSTVAAIFAKQGFPVLSDDIVAITPKNSLFLVQPAYPRVRLWSNSVVLLYDTEDQLPRIAPKHPTWDKRYLDLDKMGLYQSQPLPLKGIYLIGDLQNRDTAPRIEEVSSTEKMINLLANTYASYEFDQKMQIRDFQIFGEIAKKVKIKRLTSYKNPQNPDKLCDIILKDLPTNELLIN